MKKDDFWLLDGLSEEQRDELGDLNGLINVLESYTLSEPQRENRDRLLDSIIPYLPKSNIYRQDLKSWLRLIRSQWVMFETSFWVAGLLVLLLGFFMSFLEGREMLPLLLLVLSPLLSASSVVYVFRPETRTLNELEILTATHPVELLIARLTMVLGFNVLIAFALMLAIHLEGTQIMLGRLVLAWLGPLLTLSGLALYITLRWGVLVGVVLPLGLWGGLVMLGWREALLRSMEGMNPVSWLTLMIGSSNTVLIASVVACLLGLGLLLLAWKTVAGESYTWNLKSRI